LRFDGGKFLIECEPHIVIRLKRVFAKIDRRQHGMLHIAATEETARDLEWFMGRFPFEVDPESLSHLKCRADSHRERTAKVDAILSGHIEVPDFGLALPLREYQQTAAEVAFQRQALLLADDVGLGKTASAIGLMARGVTLPALVVTLTHLPRQWQDEFGKFAPHLSTHIIKTGKVYDIVDRHCRGKRGPKVLPDVIIISYSKLSKWADVLAPLVRTVVYDEVQELRRGNSQKAAGARHISGAVSWRMGLSATPIYNYGSEIWSVMQCLAADAIGTWDEFLNEWCTSLFGTDLDKAEIKDPRAFGAYMRESGLMLRRTRKDVGRELLPLNKCVEHIDSDMDALDSVSMSCAELARSILRHGEEYRGQKMQQSEELSTVLRQATGIAKAPFVAEYVRILLEGEQRVVLYGWHREVYSIWMDRLKEFNPVLYTGSESPTQKDEAKKSSWKGTAAFSSSPFAPALAWTVSSSDAGRWCSGNWIGAPGVHEQCEGRVLRDGQPEPVFAYYLIADNGSDPTVAQVLGIKKRQIAGLRNDGDGSLFEELQTDGNRIKDLARDFLERSGKHVEMEDKVGA
jgi:hypothetical protein